MAFCLRPDKMEPTKDRGYFMRTDRERPTEQKIPAGNVDLPYQGREFTSATKLFRKVGKYKVVHTNRLHIAVAGTLLGRDVRLYGNDYFKNRAIYESSIKPNFPKVKYAEVLDVAPKEEQWPLYTKIRSKLRI